MEKRQIKKSGQKEKEEKKIEGEQDPQKKQEKYMIVVKDGVVLPMDQARKYWNTNT